MDLAEDCEEDFEAAEYSCGENGVTSDEHVEGACGFWHGGPRFLARLFFFLILWEK